tara:strand:- start:382 stop:675 length:294 start_codon:yes stop_codon:yes gene_type:complete
MKFLEIINKKKITLISIFLFLYVAINLFDGERGLISYYEKQKQIESLKLKKSAHIEKLQDVEKKNDLLTVNIDIDYLETLYRKMFTVGKKNEKIYIE